MRNVVKGIMVCVSAVLFVAALAPSAALSDADPKKFPKAGFLVPPTPPGGSSWGPSAQQNEDRILSSGARQTTVRWVGAGRPQSLRFRWRTNRGNFRLRRGTMIPPHRR